MTHAVLLVHADPSALPRYQAALDAACPGSVVRMLNSPHKGLSSAYEALWYDLRSMAGARSVLQLAMQRAGLPSLDKCDTITVASFSAGYALVRHMLREQVSLDLLDCLVGIDSWHSGFDADGTASDVQLAGLVRYGLAAIEGPRVMWFGHSDVQTPQTGPGAYASTTQTGAELRRLCGLPAAGGDVSRGGLRVRAYDVRKDQRREHGAALTEWGPGWLADAVALAVARRPAAAPDEQPPPTLPSLALGQRALALAQAELAAGVREVPGVGASPRIVEYLAGCERDGRVIGSCLRSDEIAWCAAAASWCCARAAVEGEDLPHRWRVSVRELWADALERGTARGAEVIRAGSYVPQPGDLAILTRGGPAVGSGPTAFAKSAGLGHVGRVASWVAGGTYQSLDGNHGDRWALVTRSSDAPEFVGIIAYPQAWLDARPPTESEVMSLGDLALVINRTAVDLVGSVIG